MDAEEVGPHLASEGDRHVASDQGGHADDSREEHPDGDKGEAGAEGDPATVGRSRRVRTVS